MIMVAARLETSVIFLFFLLILRRPWSRERKM